MSRKNYTEEEKDFDYYDDDEIDERRYKKEREKSLRRQRTNKLDRPDIDEE